MNETRRDDPHAPLSYYGARRIVWLVFFVFVIWLILRALQPVILLFALVILLAMVLNRSSFGYRNTAYRALWVSSW